MNDIITAADRREALTIATREAHRELDDAIRQGEYFSIPERYVSYLQASLNARQALETALREIALVPAQQYETTAALEQDLQDLGVLPWPKPAPVQLNPASAWGTLYVLQGSSMGALHLRQWAAKIGFTNTHGARHLQLQAERAGGWRDFLARLNAQHFSATDEAACLNGAHGAFSCFKRCFSMIETNA